MNGSLRVVLDYVEFGRVGCEVQPALHHALCPANPLGSMLATPPQPVGLGELLARPDQRPVEELQFVMVESSAMMNRRSNTPTFSTMIAPLALKCGHFATHGYPSERLRGSGK